MSQRTRPRPASATAKPTRKSKAVPPAPKPVAPDETPDPVVPASRGLLSAAELARALHAVAEEVERDPALARRVGEAIRGDGDSDGGSPLPQPSPRAAGEGSPDAGGGLTPNPSPRRGRGAESALTASVVTPPPSLGEGGGRGQHDAQERGRRSFTPTLITGTAPELGVGVPDPFALRARLGEEGLRATLEEVRLGTLRAMIREHALDPSGRLAGVNDAAKLRARILSATARPRREGASQASARATPAAHSSPWRAAPATPDRPPAFDTEGEDPV